MSKKKLPDKSKSELIVVIGEQNEKIEKYENKIRDIVRAYKGICKEKEALQESLSALTANAVSSLAEGWNGREITNIDNKDAESNTDVSENESERASLSQEDSYVNEITTLKKQVAILGSTLQTLTEEKNKLESTTTAERRRILAEKNQLEARLNSENECRMKMKDEYESKLQELRSKIILSQHEVEKEANNSFMMLKEVETELSKERAEKSKLEKLLEETQGQNRQIAAALSNRSQESKQQKQISDLQNELEQVRMRLMRAEEQCKNPPILIALRTQMEQMKEQYSETILQEQRRAEAAERNFKSLSRSHEERVAALENNISEVSLSAGGWDRTNRKYLQIIESLKEKINELTDSQDDLTRSVSPSEASIDNRIDTQSPETLSLVGQFVSLGKQIRDCGISEERDLAKIRELVYGWGEIHLRCKERFKLLESKIQILEDERKIGNSSRDISTESSLQNLVSELRGRVRSLNSDLQTTQTNHDEQIATLKQEMKTAREAYARDMNQRDQDYKTTLSKVEHELMEQRQTSLFTLQDREQEIHRLSQEIFRLTQQAAAQPHTVAEALLSQMKSGGSDKPLLHHMEDLARKELEVNKLRREKIYLEKAMRDVQMSTTDKQQAMQDTIDELKEQVDRMTRNQSRECENFEYIKNVVFQYMLSPDLDSRLVILKAVGAVLKFTPDETERVKKSLNLWWWQSPFKPKEHSHRIIHQPLVPNTPVSTSFDRGSSFENLSIDRARGFSDTDNIFRGSSRSERASSSIFDDIS